MTARLFDGTEIFISKEDVESIEIEDNDYSILITFSEQYKRETGYYRERAELIKI